MLHSTADTILLLRVLTFLSPNQWVMYSMWFHSGIISAFLRQTSPGLAQDSTRLALDSEWLCHPDLVIFSSIPASWTLNAW
jgi:hypothetical protein